MGWKLENHEYSGLQVGYSPEFVGLHTIDTCSFMNRSDPKSISTRAPVMADRAYLPISTSAHAHRSRIEQTGPRIMSLDSTIDSTIQYFAMPSGEMYDRGQIFHHYKDIANKLDGISWLHCFLFRENESETWYMTNDRFVDKTVDFSVDWIQS